MRGASVALRLFESRLAERDGCLEWTGKRSRQGYGAVRIAGRYWRAHRLIYTVATGEEIPDGMFVCHTCDNPPCCNPEHLFLGTQQENMDDAVAKGRTAKGERAGNNRLTESKVHEVFVRRARGETLESIGEVLGVNGQTVYAAVQRRTWSHVQVDPELVARAQRYKRERPARKTTRRRLRADDVVRIFEMSRRGMSRREIAEHFGMTTANIRAVLMRQTWRHVNVSGHDVCQDTTPIFGNTLR